MKTFKRSVFLGVLFFLFQFFLIIFLSPDKNFTQAWLNLASHWDSGWYEAIASKGYLNDNGPANTGAYTSNVVFFPGYPYLVRILILVFGLNAKAALLIVSQGAALVFWCLFFYILKNISFKKQIYAAVLVMCFPTSWFLFMGYSESLFIAMYCLMLMFATQNKCLFSGISGAAMTATRVMGLTVLFAPLLSKLITDYSYVKSQIEKDLYSQIYKKYSIQFMIILLGSLGFLGFLIYCQLEFHSWNLYFVMEEIGWGAKADPFFLFKSATWLPPPFGYPIALAPTLSVTYTNLFVFKFFRYTGFTFSEFLVPLFIYLTIIFSFILYKKRKELDERGLTWFLAAVLLLFCSCMSTSLRAYESMSRLLLPVWILFIISDALYPKHIFFFRFIKNMPFKVFVIILILISSGFWLQMLNRYMLGWWVA